MVFARWRQRAHMGGHIGATWQIRLNLWFLWSTWVHNPNGKSIGSAVSAQLTAESPHTLQRATLSSKIAPSWGGIWTPSDSWFLEPDRAYSANGISIGSAVFAQVTAERPYTLQWVPPSPFHGGAGPPSNPWFLGPTYQTASPLVQLFLHRWLQSVLSLYFTMGCPFPPLKIAPSHGGI